MTVRRSYVAGFDANRDVLAAGQIASGVAALKINRATGGLIWQSSVGAGFTANGAMNAGGALLVVAVLNRKFAVVRFDNATGGVVWQSSTSAAGFANALVIDHQGFVVAAGEVEGPRLDQPNDFLVRKLNPDTGVVSWSKVVTQVVDDTRFDERAEAVAVDANNDVITGGLVLGDSSTADPRDFFVVKLSGANGAELWRNSVRGAGIHEAGQRVRLHSPLEPAGPPSPFLRFRIPA